MVRPPEAFDSAAGGKSNLIGCSNVLNITESGLAVVALGFSSPFRPARCRGHREERTCGRVMGDDRAAQTDEIATLTHPTFGSLCLGRNRRGTPGAITIGVYKWEWAAPGTWE
eukprot:4340904-Prymnesium_polylepis.1